MCLMMTIYRFKNRRRERSGLTSGNQRMGFAALVMILATTGAGAGAKNNMQEKHYEGISNPSAAVALDSHKFIVADDENNLLRIYEREGAIDPVQTLPLKDLFKGEIADGEELETDIEGAAELDGTIFWIGSHGAGREGELRPPRHRLFAIRMQAGSNGQFTASPAGGIYTRLIDDLEQDSRFDAYHFNKARTIPPKETGGLNIEGLAATPEHGLLIGFRNPLAGGEIKKGRLVKGRALLVNLLNPFEVLAGRAARFGDPIELALKGQGIRAMVLCKNQQYLVVAGPYHKNAATEKHQKEKSRLYSWSGSGQPKHLKEIDLEDLNIEAAFFYPGEEDAVQLLSDDGKLGAKGFRSVWLKL
jgi:hypothetical protein